MKDRVKKWIKENGKKITGAVVGLAMVFSVLTFTACGNKNDNDINPGNKVEVPVDPTPVDPTPVDPTPVDPTPVDPTPVDPTPVDPTPVDPSATEADITAFETKLEEKIGEIEGYLLDEKFYAYGIKNGTYSFYSSILSEDSNLETKKGVENLTQDIANLEEEFNLSTEKNYVEYAGQRYNFNSIKGSNIFAERVGDTTNQSVTKVILNTEPRSADMTIFVIKNDKTIIGKISTESVVELSETEQIERLLGTEYSNDEVVTIPFGMDTFKLSAETPTEVIPPEPEEPVELDYTALEEKIKANPECFELEYEMKDLLGYTVKDGDLYVLATLNRYTKRITGLYKLDGNFSIDTQEGIDELAEEIGKTEFSKEIRFIGATNDITVDGTTYSKEGIEGDNIFAQQCGVDNAVLTLVGDVSNPSINGDSSTHYSAGYRMLTIYEEDGNMKARMQIVLVEVEPEGSVQETIERALSGNYYIGGELKLEEPIVIGQLVGGTLTENSNQNTNELSK